MEGASGPTAGVERPLAHAKIYVRKSLEFLVKYLPVSRSASHAEQAMNLEQSLHPFSFGANSQVVLQHAREIQFRRLSMLLQQLTQRGLFGRRTLRQVTVNLNGLGARGVVEKHRAAGDGAVVAYQVEPQIVCLDGLAPVRDRGQQDLVDELEEVRGF